MADDQDEDQDEDQGDDEGDERPALPAGTRNYITPQGFARMQAESKYLLHTDRPKVVGVVAWAAGNGDRSENGDYIYGKRRLREIDRRLRFLTKRMESAEIIDPAQQKGGTIRFGATVTVEGEHGRRTYSIVGVDETDGARGRISWVSPIGRTLLKRNEGDVVSLVTPKGEEELEIVAVRYEALP